MSHHPQPIGGWNGFSPGLLECCERSSCVQELEPREDQDGATEAERNSPLLHLPARAGELVIAYGSHELPELCRQSIDYGRAWTERGLPGHLLPVDGANHFTILDTLADPRGVLTQAVIEMSGS